MALFIPYATFISTYTLADKNTPQTPLGAILTGAIAGSASAFAAHAVKQANVGEVPINIQKANPLNPVLVPSLKSTLTRGSFGHSVSVCVFKGLSKNLEKSDLNVFLAGGVSGLFYLGTNAYDSRFLGIQDAFVRGSFAFFTVGLTFLICNRLEQNFNPPV